MGFASAKNVKKLGKLPDSIDNGDIKPHLESAYRELKRWIGDYSAKTGDDQESCIEAECCITMAYLLPVLNTFYTQGVTTLQKEIGEMDFLFHSPKDLKDACENWMDRAKRAAQDFINDGSGNSGIGWYAI